MNKEFKKYVTDELLLIANNVTGEYTDKQVQQAKLELYNRGVDDKIIADIMEEKGSPSCEGWMPPHVQNRHAWTSATKGTGISAINGGEMLFMFMFAPFYLFKRHYLPSDFFPQTKTVESGKSMI